MSARSKAARKTAGVVLLTLSLTGMIRAAYADCTPNSATAVSGSIVTCSATTTGGFIAGAGVDNLNITILSGATVQARTTPTPSVTILLGAGNINDDDTSNVITNNGTLINAGGPQTNNYVVNLNGSNNTLINNGAISLTITAADITGRAAANTATGRAIFSSSSAGEFENIHIVNNASGTISVQHAGTGNMAAFYPGEDIEDFTIDNHGRISATRTSTLTVSVNSAGALVAATPGVTTPATLGIGAAFDSDDDTESYTIRNHAGGIIEATGVYTAAIYARAPGLTIINDGTIINNSGQIAISSHQGLFAEQDDVEKTVTVVIGKTEIQNSGTITGDIVMADANALRYWAQEAKGLTGLVLNQTGRRDSEIENHASGVINGNIYLGAGAHEIENAGTITGNINVNQNVLFTYPTAPAGYTLVYTLSGGDDDDDDDDAPAAGSSTPPADKHFTLVNSGVLDGNITIKDTAGAVNSITLINGGFSGNITATTGLGNNSLTLLGSGTLHNVTKFTTLTVGAADTGSGGGDDDDDDDGPAPAATVWTLASGSTQEFTGSATINTGSVLIVDSTLTTPAVNVLAGGTLMGSGIIMGAVNNSGIIDLRTANSSGQLVSSTLTVSGAVNLAEGSILKTTITGNGSSSADAPSSNAGLLKVGATGTVEAGAKILPVAAPGLVRSGDWYRVATNTNGGSVFDTLPGIQSSALITWTVKENADSDLVIGATVKSASSIPGISSGGAGAINTLNGYTGTNETLLNLVSALQGLQTESAVRKAAEQLRPEANGGQAQVALSVNDRINAVIDQRIAEVNIASYGTSGVSTGEGGSGRAVWVQGFGFYGTQSQRNNVDGYTASTGGIALGADTAIGSGDVMRVGIALSYASSKIDDDGVNDGNTVKIDSYGVTLYGSYAMPTWYVNGSVGLGFHKYDSVRIINVTGLRDNATGSHDGTQYSAKIEGGLPMKFGTNTLIPVASLQYSHLDQDGYTENSNLGTALAIDKSRTDSLRSGLGAKVLFDMSEPDTRMAVELRAIWLHELGNTSQDSTARFAAGGSSFTTSGVDVGRDAANLGIGMRFGSKNGRQQVMVSYDAEIRDQYIGHTAMLQARQEF
jgi:outer membrane autotransporter protein